MSSIEIAFIQYFSNTEMPLIEDYSSACNHSIDEINLHELNLNELQSEVLYKMLNLPKNSIIKLQTLSRLNNSDFKKNTDDYYCNLILLWAKIRNMLFQHSTECSNDIYNEEFLKPSNYIALGKSIMVNDMNLTVRSKNALQREGYNNSDELFTLTLETLYNFKNIGEQSVEDISRELYKLRIWQKLDSDSLYVKNNKLLIEKYLKKSDIDGIKFTIRTYNALKRKGISSITELLALKDYEIRDIRNLGEKSYEEIQEAINKIKMTKVENLKKLIVKKATVQELKSFAYELNSKIHKDLELIGNKYPKIISLKLHKYDARNIPQKFLSPDSGTGKVTIVEFLDSLDTSLKVIADNPDYLVHALGVLNIISSISVVLSVEQTQDTTDYIDVINDLSYRYEDEIPSILDADSFTNFLFGLEFMELMNHLDCNSFRDYMQYSSTHLIFDLKYNKFAKDIILFCSKHNTVPNFLGVFIAAFKNGGKLELDNILLEFLEYSRPNSFERDIDIIFMRSKGLTLDQIGKQLNLTRERIRQIVCKLHPQLPLLIDLLIAQNRNEFELAMESKVTQIIEKYGAVYKNELELELENSFEYLKEFIPLWHRKFVFENYSKNDNSKKWKKEDVLKAIQKASTYYFPLTGPQYQSLIEIGEIEGPSSQRIYQLFGTWSDMCRQAGVEYKPAFRTGDYYRKWNDMELLSFVVRFLKDENISDSYEEFRIWRENQNDEVPSPELVRNSLGTWLEIKKLALQVIRQEKLSKDYDEF